MSGFFSLVAACRQNYIRPIGKLRAGSSLLHPDAPNGPLGDPGSLRMTTGGKTSLYAVFSRIFHSTACWTNSRPLRKDNFSLICA
jgi:hypothetical protein